jgi:ParB family chromosome partitioning protein
MSKKIELDLPSVDDLFTTQEQRDDKQREKVMDIPLEQLHPFKDHPYHVMMNEELKDLAQSIHDMGVLTPVIARPTDDGYELISGHRRKAAAEMLGLETLPVIVRAMDDDTAAIIMVDSNQQRENLLPSEKAFAYKIKMDAIKRQGKRSDLTSSQVGTKLRTDELIASNFDESRNQVQRYIRLTYLIKPILKMVDDKQIAFNPAVEISYLPKKEQETLLDAMNQTQATPSLGQAGLMKFEQKRGELTSERIFEIMTELKPNQRERVSFKLERIAEYFPKGYTTEQMEKKILQMLEAERKQRAQSKDRDRGDER